MVVASDAMTPSNRIGMGVRSDYMVVTSDRHNNPHHRNGIAVKSDYKVVTSDVTAPNTNSSHGYANAKQVQSYAHRHIDAYNILCCPMNIDTSQVNTIFLLYAPWGTSFAAIRCALPMSKT